MLGTCWHSTHSFPLATLHFSHRKKFGPLGLRMNKRNAAFQGAAAEGGELRGQHSQGSGCWCWRPQADGGGRQLLALSHWPSREQKAGRTFWPPPGVAGWRQHLPAVMGLLAFHKARFIWRCLQGLEAPSSATWAPQAPGTSSFCVGAPPPSAWDVEMPRPAFALLWWQAFFGTAAGCQGWLLPAAAKEHPRVPRA